MTAKANQSTLGARIDAALAPFLEDEARLLQQIEQFRAKIQDYQQRIEQTEQDLQVIRSAKLDALRQIAGSDPLLQELFAGVTANPSAEIAAGPRKASDRHPLLSP